MLIFSVKKGRNSLGIINKVLKIARLEAKINLAVSNYQHNFMGNKV